MSLLKALTIEANRMIEVYNDERKFLQISDDETVARASINVNPIDYDFDMDKFSDVGNISMTLKEVADDRFELRIEAEFGIFNKSNNYLELDNILKGDYKYMIRFFDYFIEELYHNSESIFKLYNRIDRFNLRDYEAIVINA